MLERCLMYKLQEMVEENTYNTNSGDPNATYKVNLIRALRYLLEVDGMTIPLKEAKDWVDANFGKDVKGLSADVPVFRLIHPEHKTRKWIG